MSEREREFKVLQSLICVYQYVLVIVISDVCKRTDNKLLHEQGKDKPWLKKKVLRLKQFWF